jgi:capsular exopolysaccharide synthesis family protein
MSRIHDALKKAEQERVLAPESAAPKAVHRPPEESPVQGLPADSAPAVITVETLLRRSPQPPWKPDPKSMLALDGGYGPGVEEFRTLRSRLYKIRESQPLKTVLVTSALPAEGKTFVSANLAQIIVRQHERRALLIDADLRCSRLHTVLGTQSRPGLSDYLAGEADELAIIQRSAQGNLFFIPGGRQSSSPNELIGNGRMEKLLRRLAPVFDWIVMDSPPVLPVSDAALLAGMADGVLLVVRARETPYPLAQKARAEFVDKPMIGVVLNHAEAIKGYHSYYKYGYGAAGGNGRAKE